jgi:hypothetical protein
MGGFRSRLKFPLGIFLAAALTGTPLLAVGDNIGFEPLYWNQGMEGTIRVDGDTLTGTTVDVQDTLGLDPNVKLPSGLFWLHWLKRNYLMFTFGDATRHGDQTLASPLVFENQTFLPGERVKSRLETDLKSLVYGYNFLDLNVFKLGVRVGADRLGFNATLESDTTPTRAESDESVTFPVAGLGLAFEPIPMLRFIGEINGLAGHISGEDVHFYDARIQSELYWAHFFGIVAGYRRVKIDVDLTDFGAANLNQKGPYAGFVFRF